MVDLSNLIVLPRWLGDFLLPESNQYSKLPVTRTCSSGVSFSSDLEEPRYDLDYDLTLVNRFLGTWRITNRRNRVLSLSAVLVMILASTLVPIYFVRQSAKAALFRSATCSLDYTVFATDENKWVAHPTHYPEEEHELVTKRPLQTLVSQRGMSQRCTDLWISAGELCAELTAGASEADSISLRNVLQDQEVDVVWTSVEPSEHWRKWEQAYKNETVGEEIQGTGVSHFRSYDEIRYSIRSVVQNLPFVRKHTLLSSSLPSSLPPANMSDLEKTQNCRCRASQVPDWLNISAVNVQPGPKSTADTKMNVLSHWQLFDTRESDVEKLRERKHAILPTFNSHAIESQLYAIPEAAETVLYLNNDVYIGRAMSASDLSTSLFGPVYRVYREVWATGATSEDQAMRIDGEGNARVIPNTIRMLDDRFGQRSRSYPDHTAHVLSNPMMGEVSRVWAKELNETSAVRFRGRGPEVWLPLLALYYTVERQREVLLWSFLMAKSDVDLSGSYSRQERMQIFTDLGGVLNEDTLSFTTPNRVNQPEFATSSLASAGMSSPKETTFTWTSADGYPYVSNGDTNHLFPDYDGQEEGFCSISITKCFGRGDFFNSEEERSVSSEDTFKRVTFGEPRCGDCLIAALLTKSGQKGLEAFLPTADRSTETSLNTREIVPELGNFDRDWKQVDFSLRTALQPKHRGSAWSRRDLVVRLLQRYSYTLGETPSSFIELTDDVGFDGWLLWKVGSDHNPYIAINDHLMTTNLTLQNQVKVNFMDWQEANFPHPSPYEKEQ